MYMILMLTSSCYFFAPRSQQHPPTHIKAIISRNKCEKKIKFPLDKNKNKKMSL